MNIVLTGFMGTGKTAAGKLLAKKLNYKYVDTDELIEKKMSMRIADIFSEKGEPHFREIETAVVLDVSEQDGYVIATGGGVVLKNENMEALREKGVIINLTADAGTIYERTRFSKDRPLLDKPDPRAEIEKLLAAREQYYKNCDFRIETDRLIVEQVVEECLRCIEGKL